MKTKKMSALGGKNKISIWGMVFLAIIFASPILISFAAEGESPSAGEKTASQEKADSSSRRLVATVNYAVEEIKELGNNQFEIVFLVSNSEKVQPGVRYAISLQKTEDSGQKVFSRKVYDEVLSLNEGETVERTITYAAPENLAGEFDLFLESASLDGLLLGMTNGGKVELKGSGSNESNTSESIESLDSNSSQPRYILNVRLDKDYYAKGDTAKIILDTVPVQIEAGKISLSISDKDQKSCLEGDFQENDFTGEKSGVNELSAKIAKDCINPVFQISIKGRNGEMIDEGKYAVESKSEGARNVASEGERQKKIAKNTSKAVAAGVILFAVAALIVMIIRKIKYRNYRLPLFLLAFGSGLVFFTASASAHTYVEYEYSLGSWGIPMNEITFVANAVTPTREGGTAFYRPADQNSDGTFTRKVDVSATRRLIAAPGCTYMCDPLIRQDVINTVAGISVLAKVEITNIGYGHLDTRFATTARYDGYYVKSTATPINDYLIGVPVMGASTTISRQYEFKDTDIMGATDPAYLIYSAIAATYYVNSIVSYQYPLQDGYYVKDPVGTCNNFWDYMNSNVYSLCKYGVFSPVLNEGYEDINIENFSTSSSKGVWQCISNVTGGTNASCSQQPLSWTAPCGILNNQPVCKMYLAQSIDYDYGGYDLCGYDIWNMYRLVLQNWGWPTRFNPGYGDLFPRNGFDYSPNFYSTTNIGPWSWKCNGFGGRVSSCQTTPGTIAACGSAANSSSVSKPSLNLCVAGSRISPDPAFNQATVKNGPNGSWQWYCSTTYPLFSGFNPLGCDVPCSTPQGGCVSDSANLIYYPDPPIGTQLCFLGGTVVNPVSGEGTDASPWQWTCRDSNSQDHICQAKKIDAILKVNGSESSPAFVNAGVNANFYWDSVNAYQCRRYVAPSSDSNWTANWSSIQSVKNSSKDFQPVNGNTYSFSCRTHGTGIYSTPYYQDTANITVNVSTPTASCGAANLKTYCTDPPDVERCGSGSDDESFSSSGSKFTWDCKPASGSPVSCSATKYCSTDDIWREINP